MSRALTAAPPYADLCLACGDHVQDADDTLGRCAECADPQRGRVLCAACGVWTPAADAWDGRTECCGALPARRLS